MKGKTTKESMIFRRNQKESGNAGMISIAVVDDEQVFSDRLCRFIAQYQKEKVQEYKQRYVA